MPAAASKRSKCNCTCRTTKGLAGTWWAKCAPRAGRFKFTAPHDGQYWFMVRTLDQQGVLRPAGPPLPELKVIVDTVPPVLELKAQRGNAGEVRAQWRIRDTFLRPESLRISYRSNSTEAWQPVAADPLRPEPGSSSLVGEATWWPSQSGTSMTIRAEVTDLAGNTTASQARLDAMAGIATAGPAAAGSGAAHRLEFSRCRQSPIPARALLLRPALLPSDHSRLSMDQTAGPAPRRQPTLPIPAYRAPGRGMLPLPGRRKRWRNRWCRPKRPRRLQQCPRHSPAPHCRPKN